jgi:hypothetical protein
VNAKIQRVQNEMQKLNLQLKLPLEFVVKKRVKRTPGIRATRRLTIERRNGEAVLVNRYAV